MGGMFKFDPVQQMKLEDVCHDIKHEVMLSWCFCAGWPSGQHSLLSLSSCSSVLSSVDNGKTRARVCMFKCVRVCFLSDNTRSPSCRCESPDCQTARIGLTLERVF